jgi:hypothetical protein
MGDSGCGNGRPVRDDKNPCFQLGLNCHISEPIVMDDLNMRAFKGTNSERVIFLPEALMSSRYTLGHLKHELCVVVDEKLAPLLKSKTLTSPTTHAALPGAFPGQKHMLAHVFRVKYDQNNELRYA